MGVPSFIEDEIYKTVRDRQAIKRVRELHKAYDHEGFTISKRCLECDNDYPCPTIKALDGDK